MTEQTQVLTLTKLERQVLDLLMKNGGLSRYDVSKRLKGNAGTISRTVSGLVRERYLLEEEEKSGGVGRPRRPLTLNGGAGYVIGLDVEASCVRGAVIDFGLGIIRKQRLALKLGCRPRTALKAMCRMYDELSDGINRNRILGVGLGIPGPCNTAAGEIIFYSENPSWSGFPFKERLEKAIDKTILAEHNIFAIGSGAHWFQFHGKTDNLICVVIRAGVAAAIILDRSIYRGESGMAGEISHMKVWNRGEICECGQRGCLRSYVSAKAIVKKMKEGGLTASEANPLLELAQMALCGQKQAVRIVRKTGQAIGIAIGHMINTLGVSQVVINSDLSQAGSVFLGAIESEIRQAVPKDKHVIPRVSFGALEGYAGALGVATLALRRICGIQYT